MKTIIMLAILSSVLFADLGPAPKAPDITVTFLENGKAFTGNVTLFYNCTVPDIANDTNSPIGERDMEFICTNGVCKNEGWYYKFNPCYYPSEGAFRYTIAGEDGFGYTANMSFREAAEYKVEIDLDNKSTKKTTTGMKNCPAALIVLAAPFLLYAWKFKSQTN